MRRTLSIVPSALAVLALLAGPAQAQVEVTVIDGRQVARDQFIFDAHAEQHFHSINFTFVQPLDGGPVIFEPDPPPGLGFGLLNFFVPGCRIETRKSSLLMG